VHHGNHAVESTEDAKGAFAAFGTDSISDVQRAAVASTGASFSHLKLASADSPTAESHITSSCQSDRPVAVLRSVLLTSVATGDFGQFVRRRSLFNCGGEEFLVVDDLGLC
jgi:hypothetical protein